MFGATSSSDFPVPGSVVQTTVTGRANAFVSKLNPGGTGLVYSTVLGGTGQDIATGLAIDRFGAASVPGYPGSPDFPTLMPLQTSLNGIYDAFVTILNPAGNGLYFSSLIGGAGIDAANAVALDGAANIYIVGQTGSLDYPLVAPNPRAHSGGLDAFTLKIATDDATSFVSRLYFGIFGGPPDPPELAFWSKQLSQGTTRGQVAFSLFEDAGFQSSGFQVVAAYISVLGRDPDYGGFQFWTTLFRSGALAIPGCTSGNQSCSQLGLLTDFMGSVEFQTRFNASDNASFVGVVYQNVLGRPPDPGGLNFWVQQLSAGMTRATAAGLHQFTRISEQLRKSYSGGVGVYSPAAETGDPSRNPDVDGQFEWGRDRGGDVEQPGGGSGIQSRAVNARYQLYLDRNSAASSA